MPKTSKPPKKPVKKASKPSKTSSSHKKKSSSHKRRHVVPPRLSQYSTVKPMISVSPHETIVVPQRTQKPKLYKYVIAAILIVAAILGGLTATGYFDPKDVLPAPKDPSVPPTTPPGDGGDGGENPPPGDGGDGGENPPPGDGGDGGENPPPGDGGDGGENPPPTTPPPPVEEKKANKGLVIGLSVGAALLAIGGLVYHYRKRLRFAKEAGIIDLSQADHDFAGYGQSFMDEAERLEEEAELQADQAKQGKALRDIAEKEEQQAGVFIQRFISQGERDSAMAEEGLMGVGKAPSKRGLLRRFRTT